MKSSDKKAREFTLLIGKHAKGFTDGNQIENPFYNNNFEELILVREVLPSTDSPLNQDVEKEIESAYIDFYESDVAETGRYICFHAGAREFIKRTEERVWREAVEYYENSCPGGEFDLQKEGKRKGYIK
jgi:hypothetical protein